MCTCPPTTEIWINCNPSVWFISFKSGNLESLNRGAHHQEAGVVWWWVREMRIATSWCEAGWPRLGANGSASTVAWKPPSTRCTPTLRTTMSPSPLSASSASESARLETHSYSIGLATTKDSEIFHLSALFCHQSRINISLQFFYQYSILFLDDQDVQIAEQTVKRCDENGLTIWECLNCGYTSKKHYNVKEHVRVKHLGSPEFKCDFCDQICPSRGAHRAHVWRYHKQH